MKFLQDYVKDKQTALFEKTNAFFAFSPEQFEKGKKQGVTYVKMGYGMLCDERHVQELINGLDKIYKDGIKQDLEENGIDKIIERELWNHECFYTGDITDAVDNLKDYNITKQQVRDMYMKLRDSA